MRRIKYYIYSLVTKLMARYTNFVLDIPLALHHYQLVIISYIYFLHYNDNTIIIAESYHVIR